MLKTLLASAAITVGGVAAASASSISVIIDDYWADHDNAFFVYDLNDWSWVAFEGFGELASGYNKYTYDVDPGWYKVGVFEGWFDGVDKIAVEVNGEYAVGCTDCDFWGLKTAKVYVPEMSEVPLPASAALLLAGLAGFGLVRRRKTA